MAFGSFNGGGNNGAPMSEINMVPLIDVMLVLLVIFIITAPLLSHAVRIDVPQATSAPSQVDPITIDLAINADGELFWNDGKIDMGVLSERFEVAARQEPQPELQLRADKATRYEVLAQVMADASRAGMKRIGFVSTPEPKPVR
ncbi:ExbD/TolR family protein [Pigmentiphaga litoralis]|uniref:Biopolymer transport protein ExbD n=1 Tax=Pigmentiphaga litoralis TaxID=516702 RepID=A0A7Y9LPB0_9BURK|nr:biopolymer transporter ExbD [Pigmentiphaga litoralis]NYE26848.1 biopolymer transport protein ExbD [Pigmentiphaga litoralis]NYE85742.1 biopolymer transport protein ExbD [Pigmentiphaga litoralis]